MKLNNGIGIIELNKEVIEFFKIDKSRLNIEESKEN